MPSFGSIIISGYSGPGLPHWHLCSGRTDGPMPFHNCFCTLQPIFATLPCPSTKVASFPLSAFSFMSAGLRSIFVHWCFGPYFLTLFPRLSHPSISVSVSSSFHDSSSLIFHSSSPKSLSFFSPPLVFLLLLLLLLILLILFLSSV